MGCAQQTYSRQKRKTDWKSAALMALELACDKLPNFG